MPQIQNQQVIVHSDMIFIVTQSNNFSLSMEMYFFLNLCSHHSVECYKFRELSLPGMNHFPTCQRLACSIKNQLACYYYGASRWPIGRRHITFHGSKFSCLMLVALIARETFHDSGSHQLARYSSNSSLRWLERGITYSTLKHKVLKHSLHI